MPVMAGMRVNTKSDKTRIARGGVMEFLLANHPLDCPICDQGGECDLQDISIEYGYGKSRFYEYKRAVEDKEIGPIIKTTMTRCIHCTRCIRFSEEVAGDFNLGTTGRGKATEIGTYIENLALSELSGNIVDLCPVGALTNKPYAFKARPWELKTVPSVDIIDTILPEVSVDSRGLELMRVLPRINEDVNEEWISDKSRHSLDGNKRQRLVVPIIKNNDGKHIDTNWEIALNLSASLIKNTNPKEIEVLIGDLVDLESICCIRDMMNLLDVENISLGRNNINVDNTVRNGYLMNSKIRGLEDADLLLIVGSNPKYESPVLNSRIRKSVIKNNLLVGLIGSPYDLTYDYTHLGNTINIIIEILQGKHPFCSKIAQAKYPMMLIGSSIIKTKEFYETLINLAIYGKFINIKTNWCGFNILNNHISTIGALDLGIKPNDNLCKNAKLTILLGYDNIENNDISKESKVIYIGSHGDKGAERADIILPGATFYEKNSTYISTEGRVNFTRGSVQPPFLAKDDWEIIRALSELVNSTLPYDEINDVRNRISEILPFASKYQNIEPNYFGKRLFKTNYHKKIENHFFDDIVDVKILYFKI